MIVRLRRHTKFANWQTWLAHWQTWFLAEAELLPAVKHFTPAQTNRPVRDIMLKALVNCWILAMVALLTGCGSVPSEVDDKPQTSKLGDSIDISLSDLLNRPRNELAELAEEWTTKIHIQEKGRRAGSLYLSLLEQFRLPLVVPIWR